MEPLTGIMSIDWRNDGHVSCSSNINCTISAIPNEWVITYKIAEVIILDQIQYSIGSYLELTRSYLYGKYIV